MMKTVVALSCLSLALSSPSWGQAQDKGASPLRKAHHDYVGKAINSEDGKVLGEIVDLMVDLPGSRVTYAVVSLAGVRGNDDLYSLLPWGVIVRGSLGDNAFSTATPEQLAKAPTFPKNRWPAMTDPKWCADVFGMFDKKTYWTPTASLGAPKVQRLSEVLAMNVRNTKDENLGQIEELVVQPSDGRIAYAVLSSGGFLGIDKKFFAIPTSSLQLDATGTKPLLAATQESLKNASGFDKDNWPDHASDEWLTQGMIRTEDASDRNRSAVMETKERVVASVSFIKSRDFMGRKVTNRQGEAVGTIDELMIDLPAGRVAYAVLSVGTFLGKGDQLFAVPVNAFTPTTRDNTLCLDVDKARLQAAPVFTKSNVSVPCDRVWLGTVYEYYGIHPYWNSLSPVSVR
jgi:sporulation protein YlmC with PRC-barrel domain